MRAIFFILLNFFTMSLGAQIYTIESVPNPKTTKNSWVSDPEAILSKESVSILNQKIDKLKKINGNEVAVVVINSIGNTNHDDFASDLFNYWKIGEASTNNGLLILLIMDKRKVVFRTGYGIEDLLPDKLCVDIQQNYMVPEFKKGNFDSGILKGLDVVAEILVGIENWNLTLSTEDKSKILQFLTSKTKINSPEFYIHDNDSILSPSERIIFEDYAKRFEDSLNVRINVFIFNDLEGISIYKIADYIKNEIEYPDSSNFVFVVFNNSKPNIHIVSSFADRSNIFESPLFWRALQSELQFFPEGDNALKKMYKTFWSEIFVCVADTSRISKRIETQKLVDEDKRRFELNRIQENYNSNLGSDNNILGLILKYYLYSLVSISLLALIFLGAVQMIQDPYKKYNSLTFFAFDIWIYLFPFPYYFIGKWIDKLRQRYRDEPRKDPKTGELMTKLSEEEEDEFLKSGQMVEESINSIHYDVWATADRKNLLILPYPTLFTKFSRCIKCRYKTYYLVFKRTIYPATTSSSGLGEKKYACKHCNHIHQYTYHIPRISESNSSSGGGGGGSFGGGSSGGGGGSSSW